MRETQLFVNTTLQVDSRDAVLKHIAGFLAEKKCVKASYLEAIFQREACYPTGIDLGFAAVAIPHCDASHAESPCIYVIKTDSPIAFERADEEGEVEVRLIIALVVTQPQQQLRLLKALFSSLQSEAFYNVIMRSNNPLEISAIFNNKIVKKDKEGV